MRRVGTEYFVWVGDDRHAIVCRTARRTRSIVARVCTERLPDRVVVVRCVRSVGRGRVRSVSVPWREFVLVRSRFRVND